MTFCWIRRNRSAVENHAKGIAMECAADEAVENILNMFAHTKNNAEFINMVTEKQNFVNLSLAMYIYIC